MKESYKWKVMEWTVLNKWTIDVLTQLFMVDVNIQDLYPHMV